MRLGPYILGAVLALASSAVFAKDGSGGIPDLRIARAEGDIVAAWLIAPTKRYEHFVLGSRYEAGGLRVRLKDGSTADLMLPENAVFEDRTPRIADLNGNGRNEVILVKSRLDVGSSLAIVGLKAGKPAILAETPPNGRPRRWLNPAGIGDFLANGKLQVAIVRMPHLAGKLEFWSFDKGRLKNEGALVKVSNHQIGSRHQGLSTVLRRRQGGDLLVIPSFDFRSLKVIAATPAPHEVASYALADKVAGDLSIRNGVASVPLASGRIQRISLK